MSEEFKTKVRAVREFKQRTQAELGEIAQNLLAPDTQIYAVDFGEPIGTLNFKRIRFADMEELQSLVNDGRNEEALMLTAKLLSKYSADDLGEDFWLEFSRNKDRANDFNKIALNVIGLSRGGPEGMVEFFRQVRGGE